MLIGLKVCWFYEEGSSFFSIQIKRTKIRSQGVFLHVTTKTWFVQQMAKHLVAIDDENI